MVEERLRGAQVRAASTSDAGKAEFGEYGALVNGKQLKTGDAMRPR